MTTGQRRTNGLKKQQKMDQKIHTEAAITCFMPFVLLRKSSRSPCANTGEFGNFPKYLTTHFTWKSSTGVFSLMAKCKGVFPSSSRTSCFRNLKKGTMNRLTFSRRRHLKRIFHSKTLFRFADGCISLVSSSRSQNALFSV